MKAFASAVCVLSLLGTGAAAQTFDDLKKDGNGVWRGKAEQNGKAVNISVDFQGNVVAQ